MRTLLEALAQFNGQTPDLYLGCTILHLGPTAAHGNKRALVLLEEHLVQRGFDVEDVSTEAHALLCVYPQPAAESEARPGVH